MPRRPEEMGIQEYQDYTFAINDRPDRRLTDRQLLDDWARRFPGRSAKVYAGSAEERRSQIRGIRGHYNRRQKNEHGKRDDTGQVIGPPDSLSLPYDDHGRPFVYDRGWLDRSLNGRSPTAVGRPPSILQEYFGISSEHSSPNRESPVRLTAREYLDVLINNRRGMVVAMTNLSSAAAGAFSAALDNLGLPYLRQYSPSSDLDPEVQQELEAYLASHPSVREQLETEERVDEQTLERVAAPRTPAMDYFVDPPAGNAGRPRAEAVPRLVDWTQAQEFRSRIGRAGECFVLELERVRLKEAGRSDLADRIEWVARTKGDGAGFDIRSFEADGSELCIEVKTTTNNSKRAPFFVSAAEVRYSGLNPGAYRLYRVFSFAVGPFVYVLRGSLSASVVLTPAVYQATPR